LALLLSYSARHIYLFSPNANIFPPSIQPDSEKSTTEHLGDKFKGNTDKAASYGQPQDEKSYTQQAGDMMSGGNKDVRRLL
jgi:hypothetical protein